MTPSPELTRAEEVRDHCRPIISNVLIRQAGLDPIDKYLALGRVCPVANRADVEVWLDEIRVQMGDCK